MHFYTKQRILTFTDRDIAFLNALSYCMWHAAYVDCTYLLHFRFSSACSHVKLGAIFLPSRLGSFVHLTDRT
jgi:hypothetical protein